MTHLPCWHNQRVFNINATWNWLPSCAFGNRTSFLPSSCLFPLSDRVALFPLSMKLFTSFCRATTSSRSCPSSCAASSHPPASRGVFGFRVVERFVDIPYSIGRMAGWKRVGDTTTSSTKNTSAEAGERPWRIAMKLSASFRASSEVGSPRSPLETILLRNPGEVVASVRAGSGPSLSREAGTQTRRVRYVAHRVESSNTRFGVYKRVSQARS